MSEALAGAADREATPVVPGPAPPAGRESPDWVRDLRGAPGPARDRAVERLHELLLRATRFEVRRRAPGLPHLRGHERDDIAMQAADDALMSVLRRIGDFRGESRFSTWVYKFGLLEASVTLRRRAWQAREVPLDPERWGVLAGSGPGPAEHAEQGEFLAELRTAIRDALTPHQRRVLVAIALDGVPIDVLAERLGTTRGALYKTIHDARVKLRSHLARRGLSPGPATEGSR